MPTYQAPRGMRDLLPEEAAGFDALQAVIQARARRYGYPRIDTPIVEDRAVFTRAVGEMSDVVKKEMFDVSLHGSGDLVLRPEGTAAVTRLYLQAGLHRAPQPQRFFYFEPMFRGERPQLLRFRQFWQWGLECYGAAEPGADLEQIEFTAGLFSEVGFSEYVLKINTVGDTAQQPRIREALRAYFERFRAELDDDCKARLDSNVLRIFDCKNPNDKRIAAGAPKLRELVSDADRAHFDAVTEGLDRLGVAYQVDETLARGFDYYTRTVFEFHLTNPEFTKAGDIAVAAGGRYDGLVETMGGPAVSGVGIAGGVDVLYHAMKKQGAPVGRGTAADVYVLSAERGDGADRLQIAAPLRNAGFSVAVEHSDRPLDKQLESAVKHGAKVAVIRGTEESRGGNLIVRDLVAKTQRVTRLAAVVAEVSRHVPKRLAPRVHEGEPEDSYVPDPRD